MNTEKGCYSVQDESDEIDSNKCESNIEIRNGLQFVPENGLRQVNGEVRIYQDSSCRPKCSVNGSISKVEPNFNPLDKHRNDCHNDYSLSHYHDCLESQYLFVPTVDSQCFCSIRRHCDLNSDNELPKENRNINSHMCCTVVCDGMESYFNEHSTLILNSDSNKLLNGKTLEKSEQNNLNSEVKVNGSIVVSCDTNRSSENGGNLKHFSKSEISTSLASECNSDDKSIEEYNGQLCNHHCEDYSFSHENDRQLTSANIICDTYDKSSANNDAAQEMDCIELDINPVEIAEENQNPATIDSDIGSDCSRGSSPQLSSYDSGNDNEEVNIDCLTETNSVNEDEENNDLGNNLHGDQVENE